MFINLMMLLSLVLIVIVYFKAKETKKVVAEVAITNRQRIDLEKEELAKLRESKLIILKEIKAKEKELDTLQNAVHVFKNRSKADLPLMIEEVLNDYERQGIQLPVDIIDELAYIVLENKEQACKYIESQRQAWKLRNSQKFVKGL